MNIFEQLYGKVVSTFNRGQSFFIVSSAVSQIFPLVAAPIVSRIYSPEDFGVYAVFSAVSAILSCITVLSLNNAVLVEKTDKGGAQAVLLALTVAIFFALVLSSILFIVPESIWMNAFGESVTPLLVWIPISVLVSNFYLCLHTWAVYRNRFSLLARNKLILGFGTAIFQVSIGFISPDPFGFIVANIVSFVLASSLLVSTFLHDMRSIRPEFSTSAAWSCFCKHLNFPLYSMPAILVNVTGRFIPDIMINRTYGAAQLGQYSLAVRMVNYPLNFFTVSMQDIFRQKASSELRESDNCKTSFRAFFLVMISVAAVILVPFVMFFPYVFTVIFGKEWSQAGGLIHAMSILVVTRFISSPLSFVWILRGRQRLDFFWQVSLLGFTLFSFLVIPEFFPNTSLETLLWIFSSITGFWYAVALYISWKISHLDLPQNN